MNKLLYTIIALVILGFLGFKAYDHFAVDSGKPTFVNQNYEAVLPCADCSGIHSQLTLNSDHTYKQTDTYLDKNENFTQKGNWEFDKEHNIITIKDDSSSAYLKVTDKGLLLLDADKQEVTGPLKDNYLFKKK